MISVIACTYNRADLLDRLLSSLARQGHPASDHEIIVVDNNSSDGTRAVVERHQARGGPVRYALERRQGLSHARNRGLDEATGTYVAYIDDDCRAPPEWLAVAQEVIDARAPAAFGGPYYADYITPKPQWYRDDYGSHVQWTEPRALSDGEYLDGGNIFFRTDALRRVGGFSPALGMSGGELGYGEETVALRDLREAMPGALVWYDPRLFVYHLVRPEKMTLRWLVRDSVAAGRSEYLVFHRDRPDAPRQGLLRPAVRAILGLAWNAVWGPIGRNRSKYPFVRNYIYEHSAWHLRRLGQLLEQRLAGRTTE